MNIQNPFSSYNENAFGPIGDLERADFRDQPSYLRPAPITGSRSSNRDNTPALQGSHDFISGEPRVEEASESQGTALNHISRNVDYGDNENQRQVTIDNDDDEIMNLKKPRSGFNMDDIDYDEEEFKRIEKILK